MDNQYPYGQQPAQNPYQPQPQVDYDPQPYGGQPVYPQQPPTQINIQQQPYQTTAYTEEPVSIGDWILTFLLSGIPLVGLIMFIVWLASSSTKKSKKNYLIAGLIWGLIISVVTGILVGILVAVGVSMPEIVEDIMDSF